MRSYTRTAPRRRGKRATPAVYYECQSKSGHRCGTHHATAAAAYAHTVRLNKGVRRSSRKTSSGRADLYTYERHSSS